MEELVVLAQNGDIQAREQVILQMENTIKHIIYKNIATIHREQYDDDLLQIGRIKVNQMIDKFDIKQGNTFKSFVYMYILGEIKHFLRDFAYSYRFQRKYKDIINQLYKEELTREEICRKLNVTEKQIDEATLLMTTMAFDKNITLEDNNESCLSDIIKSEINIEDEYIGEEYVNGFLETLTMLQKFIVKGLLSGYEQKEVAYILDLSTYKICREVAKIRKKYELYKEVVDNI